MKTGLRRILWALGALLGLVLLVAGSWFLSNSIDAEPQPWPAALTPAADRVARADNLYFALLEAPQDKATLPVPLDLCKGGDCLSAWREQGPAWLVAWAKARPAHQAFGEVCARWSERPALAFEDPLPTQWTLQPAIPKFAPVVRCVSWLLGEALAASDARRTDQALDLLTQSARVDQALMTGSRSLIGHLVSVSMIERRLLVMQLVAQQHPAQVAALMARLPPNSAAEVAAAQRRWIAHEASFNRGVSLSMQEPQACKLPEGSMASEREPEWLCRLGQRAAMPQYAAQLTAARWQALLDLLDASSPLASVQAVEHFGQRQSESGFGSTWHWRGTIPHILGAVAAPAYRYYFARSADTFMAQEVTQLWLQMQSEQVPTALRAAWLAEQLKAKPWASQLKVQADGSWQLQRLTGDDTQRRIRWPAPA